MLSQPLWLPHVQLKTILLDCRRRLFDPRTLSSGLSAYNSRGIDDAEPEVCMKQPLPEIVMAKEGSSFSYIDRRLKGYENVATVVPGSNPIFSECTTDSKLSPYLWARALCILSHVEINLCSKITPRVNRKGDRGESNAIKQI